MSKSVRKILRNSVLQTLNVYTGTAINFLMILIYTRALGPERFGSLVTSQAQVLVWVMLVDLGLYGGLISALTAAEADKEVERQGFRAADLVKRVLGIRMLGAIVGTMLVAAFAAHHAREGGVYDAEIFWQDMAFTPHLFALAYQQTFTAYGNFRGRFLLTVIGNIAGVAVSAALSAYLAWQGKSIAVLLLAQCWGGFLAGTIILSGMWWRPRFRGFVSRREQKTRGGAWVDEVWKALFKDAWPYAVIFAASVLWQRLDQLTASHFLGFAAGGQYALAVRLMAIPMMVANAVQIAIFPDIQRVGRDAPEKIVTYVGTSGKVLFRFGLPLIFVLLVLIRLIMVPLFPKFAGARELLFWFAPGIWGYWLQNFFMAALYGLRAFKEVVMVHVYSLIVYVVALLVFVHFFGLVGVVWGYDIFCLALAFYALSALKKAGHLAKDFSLFGSFSPAEKDFLAVVRARTKPWARVGVS